MRATIVLLPGDGVGPEVVAGAVRVLERVADLGGHQFVFVEALIGGAAIDAVGNPLPECTLDACRDADALLLGAVGGPRWADPALSLRPEQGLLRLRQALDLFANLRPVRSLPALADHTPWRPEHVAGVDLLIVRELASGIYYGPRQEADEHGSAWDTMAYGEDQVRRVAGVAFGLAERRERRLCSVDKANVLASMRLWRRTVNAVAEAHPSVVLEHQLVDACALHLLQRPTTFDVVVAGNLFGDILSDLAAALVGSLGLLPSASLGAGTLGLYEPVHGSAPDIAGRGIANPIGTILSAALLLRHSLGLDAEAEAIERAVGVAVEDGARTADLAHANMGKTLGTAEMTTWIVDRLDLGS